MTKRKKICIIGHFGGKKKFNDGQTVKTKEIRDFLVDCGYEISVVDTYYLKRKLLGSVFCIIEGVRKNDAIILIVSSRGYKIISQLLMWINRRFGKELFDFVIGGSGYQLLDQKPKYKDIANGFKKIFVETNRMKREYEKRGMNNVEVIPNFKKLNAFPARSGFVKDGELHTCTFSRVIEEKGISEAIEAIRIANETDKRKRYYLDIYGKVDDVYSERFYSLLDAECVEYKGEADPSDASQIINQYDVLLFPTYWRGEGFPGTIIDAFFAAVPVVATDWNDNFEILKDGENGIKIKIKSPEDIAKSIKAIAHDSSILKIMSKNNHNEARKYEPKEAMYPFLRDIEVKHD